MQYIFRTFNVGAGDCITLLLKDNNKELHIMVDCGSYTPEVNEYIVHDFHCHIDYLIVSHIDNDHILGLISMLSLCPTCLLVIFCTIAISVHVMISKNGMIK